MVDEYRGAHPSVSGSEIREALRMTQVTAGSNKGPVALALSLGLGLLVMALTLAGSVAAAGVLRTPTRSGKLWLS